MKIDFIHIGMHKTASTYLQKAVFPKMDNLNVINQDVAPWFYDEFIKVNSHKFDSNIFLKEFIRKSDYTNKVGTNILAISEENLSGDIYSGQCSKELMHRLKECFDDAQILIVLRNPVDYILSAYSNYVLHGGTKTIRNWLFGQETRFGEILEKLHYSYLVNEYIETFGQEKVTVVLYEKMFDKEDGVFDFIKKFNLSCGPLKSGRVNVGRSLLVNHVLSFLNFFHIYKIRGVQKIIWHFPSGSNDRKKVKALLSNYHESFNQDNSKLSSLLKVSLPEVYFF